MRDFYFIVMIVNGKRFIVIVLEVLILEGFKISYGKEVKWWFENFN